MYVCMCVCVCVCVSAKKVYLGEFPRHLYRYTPKSGTCVSVYNR
jgi:hypothetical protein